MLNYQPLIVLSFFCLVLLACRKEPVTNNPSMIPPVVHTLSFDSANYAGDFYVQRTRDGSDRMPSGGSNVWSDTADVSISITRSNDTLTVLGYPFKIDSVNQDSFTYTTGQSPPFYAYLIVKYSNNYDSLYIFYQEPCGNFGPCSRLAYTGIRSAPTTLPNSGSIYTLQVQQKNTITGIDTQYTRDIAVNYTRQSPPPFYASDLAQVNIDLEGQSFHFKGFVSTIKETEHLQTIGEEYAERVYWKNDSFYLEHDEITLPPSGTGYRDTVYYSYAGRKL